MNIIQNEKEIICYCRDVTKSEIENAISQGAKTLKDIQDMTSACTGNMCEELNPKGRCCSSEIIAMLPKSKIKCSCCGN